MRYTNRPLLIYFILHIYDHFITCARRHPRWKTGTFCCSRD